MKQCLRRFVLLIRRLRDVFTVKRRTSTPLIDLDGHVHVQILTHDSMAVCSFEHNFPLLRLMFTNVSTVRRDDDQFFTKKDASLRHFDLQDVSLCKFSHRRTCMYAICHIISYVLSRLPRFHTNVSFAH